MLEDDTKMALPLKLSILHIPNQTRHRFRSKPAINYDFKSATEYAVKKYAVTFQEYTNFI